VDYCVLSFAEAGQLEHWGQWPKCAHHHHVKKREALKMIAEDSHRLVGGEDTCVEHPVSMIVPLVVQGMWSLQPTSRLMGFQVWGLPPIK
jgi:hypothetical protein